jgi:thiazole synthase ThiGH ThiG subunit
MPGGAPSEATAAMELKTDVLLNTAVAQSNNPAQMAYAMNLGVNSRTISLFSQWKKNTTLMLVHL